MVWPAQGTSQAVAAWPSPAQEDSTAARSDPLHPMGILCPSCWSGVIGWLGKTVSNVGQARKGLGVGALEHPQGEEQARSGLQARLDRTHFYSTFCKNTCYWVRTGFVLYFIIISTLFWREKKNGGQPLKEAGKVLVSARCCSLFSEQSGRNKHGSFSIPHKYFLLTFYERRDFDKCCSSARSWWVARTMVSNLKDMLVKLWWDLLTKKHRKE